MYWTAAIRAAFFGASLIFTPTAHADQALDEKIMTHIMPRFDEKARDSMERRGARYITTRWESETRTLVAVGELESRDAIGLTPVAWRSAGPWRAQQLKEVKVDEICRYTGVRLIKEFLEEHAVTVEFIYSERRRPGNPLIVTIAHRDLEVCV